MEDDMKHKHGSVIVGALVVLGLLAVRSVAAPARPGTGAAGTVALNDGAEPCQNAELENFFEAKTAVFENDWAAARAGMERYLRDYPAGKMRDEAMYWLGRSFDRLARDEKTVARVIELKTRAAETLDRMIRQFPKSLWRDDAQELRVTIAGELAVLGVSSERKIVEEAARSQNKTELEVRRVALNSLGKLDPKTAIPALRDLLATEPDPGLRKECVSILGRKSPSDVSAILENAARSDADESVRDEARYWLEKIRVRLIPVQLNYYCFEVRLSDPSQYGKVPEGAVASFPLAHGRAGGKSAAKEGTKKVFSGGISFTGSKASSEGASDVFEVMRNEGTTVLTSHRIGGFQMSLEGGSITKTPESISGRVLVDDMVSPFKVDRQSDVLLAARRGERLAVMYLEMAPKDVAAFEKATDEDSPSGLASFFQSIGKLFTSKSKEPVYYTESNFSKSGLVIYSTLHSTPESSKQDVFDYSLAKAEIPGPGGTWTLTGHLLLLNKENILVGRMAKLVQPDGKIAWEGDEIRVPLADPTAFTTGGKAAPAPASGEKTPPAVESKYVVSFNLDGGGWIHSSRKDFRLAELSSDVLDFDEAKAVMPGPGGNWLLTGRLVLMRGQDLIMARAAVLTNAAGEVVAEAAILMVPVKNPENYTLAKARSD
jgi:hypothetical protein